MKMANEKRLIDANAFFAEIERRFCVNCDYFDGKCEECLCLKVGDMLANTPTVDAVEEVRSRVDDTIFEVDPEHGVVKHKIYEVCVVYKTTATDDNGMEWDDFYTSDDIDTAYKTRQEAEANLCSYGERKET